MAESEGATPADGARESPSTENPSIWRLGRIAVAGGLAVSAAVHLALVGTVLFVSPRLGHPEPVRSVPVELVTPDELAAAKADQPAKPDQPGKSGQPNKPELTAKPDQQQANPGQSTKPEQQAKPTQPTPSEPQGQSAAAAPPPQASFPLDAFSLPLVPGAPQPAPASPPAGTAKLADLVGLPVTGLTGGPPSEYQAKLSANEIQAFAAHVQGCWISPAGLAGAQLNVVIRVALRRDGHLMGSPVLIAAPASAQGPALVQSAMLALQKCQPYGDLPVAKYKEWRLLDLHFSPDGMSTANPVSGGDRAPS